VSVLYRASVLAGPSDDTDARRDIGAAMPFTTSGHTHVEFDTVIQAKVVPFNCALVKPVWKNAPVNVTFVTMSILPHLGLTNCRDGGPAVKIE
jgi:hypothetical protein